MYPDGTADDGEVVMDEGTVPAVGDRLTLTDGREAEVAGYAYDTSSRLVSVLVGRLGQRKGR